MRRCQTCERLYFHTVHIKDLYSLLPSIRFTLGNMEFTLDNMKFTLDNMEFTFPYTLDNMEFTLNNMTPVFQVKLFEINVK